MWNSKKSANLSIVVCGVLSVVLIVLLFTAPWVFEVYMTAYRGFSPDGEALNMLSKVFGICFYSSAGFAAIILYSLMRILFNIKKGQVFILQNAKSLKIVSWCCFVIAIITLISGFYYVPFLFITVAGGFTGMLLRVLKNVMQSAVELREENDLTI